MGGMQVLQWAESYPDRMFAAVCIASAARHSAQNIAFHEVGRQAVMADPDWRGGAYAAHGVRPEKGLAVARMAAHITYLSEAGLTRKFGRELQKDGLSWGFDADFQVESYLRHQGISFVDRFDANAYLYITRAMDYFDLAAAHGGSLAKAFQKARDVRFCVFSFTSDWLYPTVGEPRDRPRAQRGGRPHQLPRDRDRQGPRRLPARGAGAARRPRRLPGIGRPGLDRALSRRGPPDFEEILRLVPRGARVLDIGCGEGELLDLLTREKAVDGRGLEISPQGVSACLARGLSVVQGDADRDLDDYPDRAFDCVILSQTLQQVRDPRHTLASCCASANAPSSPSPTSATGGCGWPCSAAAACRPPAPFPIPGGRRRTSTSAPWRTSTPSAPTSA